MLAVTPFTAAGGQRPNQDAHVVQTHPAAPDVWLCALADGQGGQHGAAEAAQVACASVLASLLGIRPALLPVPSVWCEVLTEADRAVAAHSEAGYTTLLAFALIGDSLVGASSGDSAVLVVPHNGKATEATARQVKNPPIGSGEAEIVPFAVRLTAPWSVLAMSDGVWKFAGWERMAAAARTLRGMDLVDRLQESVRLPGSGLLPDDFTLVVFEPEEPARSA
jgi:hypothetical protein